MPTTVLLLTVEKKSKFDGREYKQFAHQIGESARALETHIKNKYVLSGQLVKNDKDDFPYFTDGGFRYFYDTADWEYTFTAIPYEIIEE